MRHFDVCNGDADGLCALVQWRLHESQPATLLTGLKREIALLQHVQAQAGDEVNVFDLSMLRNRGPLQSLLDAGVRVRYFDHHAVGEAVPVHPMLQAHVDLSRDACTSLLVDQALDGAFRAWALVGAYGDNLRAVATRLADEAGLSHHDQQRLRWLGEAINYNAYGETVQDVCMAPAQLYERMRQYADPFAFIANEPAVLQIDAQRLADLQLAQAIAPASETGRASVRILPDAPWSRRVQGCLANELAHADPQRAQAVLKPVRGGAYVVSVRAPLAWPSGADLLCGHFGGSGRARAAGIDALPEQALPSFVAAFQAMAWGEAAP